MTDTKTTSVLEELLRTVENGEKGFGDAADKLSDDGNPSLAQELREMSQQRLRMANELKDVAASSAAPLESGEGTVPGAVHRSVLALRDALTGEDPYAILAAAEQGEDHAVAEYEKALEESLPESVRTVVERQFTVVKAAHDRVRELRDEMK